MKKTIPVLYALLLLLLPWFVAAQDVVGLEYFVDSDPGVGAGTWVSVIAGTEIERSFTVDVSSLSPGFHSLFVRAVDSNGAWSLPVLRPFLKQTLAVEAVSNIDAAEYFFDSDPGVGNASPIPIDPGDVVTHDFAIDLSGLSGGLHVFYLRVRDANGAWSTVTLKTLNVERISLDPLAMITGAEYFFDTDPGIGSGTSVELSQGVQTEIAFNVDLSGLPPGLHVLHVRTVDADGRWSLVTLKPFLSETMPTDSLQHVVAAEYFIDTDPGFGEAFPVVLEEGTWPDIQFVADLGDLSEGMHQLHVRSVDHLGHWSLLTLKPFRLETALSNEPPGDIVRLEWVFRTNDSATDTLVYTDFASGPNLDFEYEADLSALNPYLSYDYYLHLVDDRGGRSQHYIHPFTMQPSPGSFALLTPVNNDTLWTTDTTLLWQSTSDPDTADSVVHYDVWLDTLSDLSTAVQLADSIADTTLSVDNLLDDHTYWWAVRATDSNTPGSWSRNLGSFNIYIPEPPQPFALVAPDSGMEFPDEREFPLVFRWQTPFDPDPGDTVFCELQISADEEFSEPLLFDAGWADTFAVSELTPGLYWWRVQAHDCFGFEIVSPFVWTIDVTLSQEELNAGLPDRYGISALYPNPFNPVLTVVVGLPEPAFLKVDVYNVLGRHVTQLTNGSHKAGYHRFQLRSDHLSSGVYLVRAVVPGRLNEVMRVVLLR